MAGLWPSGMLVHRPATSLRRQTSSTLQLQLTAHRHVAAGATAAARRRQQDRSAAALAQPGHDNNSIPEVKVNLQPAADAASQREGKQQAARRKRPNPRLSRKMTAADITSYINNASSVEQLQQLMDLSLTLNAVQVSTMMVKVSKLCTQLRRKETSPAQSFSHLPTEQERKAAATAATASHEASLMTAADLVKNLLKLTQVNMVELDARGIVAILHSMARLSQLDDKAKAVLKQRQAARKARTQAQEHGWQGLSPPPQLQLMPALQEGSLASSVADDLLYMSMQHLADCEPQGMWMLLYAVACLELKPQRQWMAAFFRHSLPVLAGFGPQGLANVIWALATLGLHPEAEWEKELYRQCIAQLPGFGAQALSITLWAFGTLDLKPSDQVITKFLEALTPAVLAKFSAQNMCNTVWGLARSGAPVPRSWLLTVVQATQPRLNKYESHSLCTLLHSLALLGFVPLDDTDTAWLLAIQERLCTAAQQHKTPPRVLSNTLHALGKLQLQPKASYQPLVPALLSASLTRMPDFSPQSLANTSWALARLGVRPGASWMAVFADQSCAKLGLFNAQELSNTVWALATMRYTPDLLWMTRFDEASAAVLNTYAPQNLSDTAWAFASLRYKPSRDWSAAFLRQLQSQHVRLTKAQAKRLLLALPDLGIAAPPALMVNLSQQVTNDVPSFSSGQQLVEALVAATKAGVRPKEQWMRLLTEELRDHMHDMDLQALADVWSRFGALGFDPGADWVQEFGSALKAAAPSGSTSAAAQIIISSARPSAMAGNRLRGVPGGPAVLQALVRRIIPVPGPTSNTPSAPSTGQHPDAAPARMQGGLGSSTPEPASALAVTRPRFQADEISQPVMAGAGAVPGGSEDVKPHGGLQSLDGSQALLLADALVQLGFGSLDAVMGLLSGAARRQARPPV